MQFSFKKMTIRADALLLVISGLLLFMSGIIYEIPRTCQVCKELLLISDKLKPGDVVTHKVHSRWRGVVLSMEDENNFQIRFETYPDSKSYVWGMTTAEWEKE